MTPKPIPYHGWINIDKEGGITSFDVVARVRRILSMKKVGHAGTLDPMATGILPIAIGDATKTIAYAMDGEKSYHFTVKWGSATNTDDREGEAISHSQNRPDEANVRSLLPTFIGTILQRPPQFSAIKINGQRSYKLARAGEHVEIPERPVVVHDLVLETHNNEQSTFVVHCGKGTYIRSLARDMGEMLGCFGHVTTLRRLSVGKFMENNAISLDKLKEIVHNAAPLEVMYPVDAVLDDIPALQMEESDLIRLRQGQIVNLSDEQRVQAGGHSQVRIRNDNKLSLIAEITSDNSLKPLRVFNI